VRRADRSHGSDRIAGDNGRGLGIGGPVLTYRWRVTP
jgi:hypothetical protein